VDEARKHIQSKNKVLACHHLKLKKHLEQILDKKTATCLTLEQILNQIDQSETDQAALLAFKAGTSALKSMISQPGFTVEDVEQTVEELNSALVDHQEIENVLSEGIAPQLGELDEEQLENELNDLIALELPSVPTSEPKLQVPIHGREVKDPEQNLNLGSPSHNQKNPQVVKNVTMITE
jgi:charged multivesicular body protein 7